MKEARPKPNALRKRGINDSCTTFSHYGRLGSVSLNDVDVISRNASVGQLAFLYGFYKKNLLVLVKQIKLFK